MIFASFAFLCWFAPVFFAVYFALPRTLRNLWLTLASFVFYGWWKPPYVALMFATTLLDWATARAMGEVGSARPRKLLLWASIAANLGVLGFFKYANLFVHTAEGVTGTWGWTQIVLPVGISFYTFQSMSYVVDVYRGDMKPARSLLDVLCYVSMFPQLVAGPIVRYRDVQDQLHGRTHSLVKASDGVFLFAIGFAKKVLIADQIAPLANAGLAVAQPGLVEAWTGIVAYALQLYFDFSGYSDMAIGLGLILGFRLPPNFLSPFRAQSVTELWRRWHISLSTWLRDYLYIPLGGNRLGEGRMYVNLLVTMMLGGLWHGAAWTFLLWGAWHGFWLALERRLFRGTPWAFLPMPLRVALTFGVFLFGLVLFAAPKLPGDGGATAGELGGGLAAVASAWAAMLGFHGVGAPVALPWLGGLAHTMLAAGVFVVFALPNSERLVRRFHPLVMLGVFFLFLLAVCHLFATAHVPFLYYQF